MRTACSSLGALLWIGAASCFAHPLDTYYFISPVFKTPTPQAPDAQGPGFYTVCPNGYAFGPNYNVYPPCLPYNGMLPGELGKYILGARDFNNRSAGWYPQVPTAPTPLPAFDPRNPLGHGMAGTVNDLNKNPVPGPGGNPYPPARSPDPNVPYGGLFVGPDGKIHGPAYGPDRKLIGPDGQLYGPGDLSLRSDGKIYGPGDRLIGDGKIFGPGGLAFGLDGKIHGPDGKIYGPGGFFYAPDGSKYGATLGADGNLYAPGGLPLGPGPSLTPQGMPFGGVVLGLDNAILGPTFGPEARVIGPNGQWYRSGELRFNRDGMVVTPDERVLGSRIYGLGGMSYGVDGKIYLPGERTFGQGGLYAGAEGKRYGPALGPSGKLYGPGGVVLPSEGQGNGFAGPNYQGRHPNLGHAIGPQGSPEPGYAMPAPFLPAPGYAMGPQNMPAPGYRPDFAMGPIGNPTPGGYQPNFPTPGYSPNLPFVGYEPPPAAASPVRFGVNPYVRSPRDFFMWGDMVDEQKRRERRPGLVQ